MNAIGDHDVIFGLVASKMFGVVRVVGTFARIVKPPIQPINIEVCNTATCGVVTHGDLGVAEPLVAGVQRISQCAIPTPAVVEVRPQHDRVKAVDSLAKQGEVEFSSRRTRS